MGSISKRGEKWRVRYIGPGGDRLSKTFDTRKLGRAFLQELEDPASRPGVAPERMTVPEWVNVWWEVHTGHLKQSTRAGYRGIIDLHILPYFKSYEMSEVDSRVVGTWQNWLRSRTGQGRALNTATLLSTIFESAVRDDVIPANPMRAVKRPVVDRKEAHFLTPIELVHLANRFPDQYRAFVFVGGFMGLRIGETLALKPEDLNFGTNTLDVVRTVTRGEAGWTLGPPKTRASKRNLVMPSKVANLMREHVTEFNPKRWLFPNSGGGMMSPGNFRDRVFRPAADEAGLLPLVPHDLRHTAVSLWIKSGANPKEVAARAGHSSVSEVLDRYGHLYDAADRELATRLDDEVLLDL